MRLCLSLAARCCSFTISRHAPVAASRDALSRFRKSGTDRVESSSRQRFPSMALREELLKAIWHAFTALDVDQSGKVSKSQLKVNTFTRGTSLKQKHARRRTCASCNHHRSGKLGVTFHRLEVKNTRPSPEEP